MSNRISYRDVLRHHAIGRSIREIAAACYCSSSAVQDILARADERGVGWDDVAPLSDDDARRLVRGNSGKGGAAFAAIDYERIDREMARDRTHFIIGERSFGTLSDSRGMVSASSWNGVHRHGTMSRLSCNNQSASALMTSFTTDSASCPGTSWMLVDPSSKRGRARVASTAASARAVLSAMLSVAVIAFL